VFSVVAKRKGVRTPQGMRAAFSVVAERLRGYDGMRLAVKKEQAVASSKDVKCAGSNP
jgi:hypothetical protein